MIDLDYEKSEGFSFGGKNPKPADQKNLDLTLAFFRLLETKSELESKIAAVPSYTAQYQSEDFYADEQEDFNRAVDAFGEAVKAVSSSG
jgi:hypothetical protein